MSRKYWTFILFLALPCCFAHYTGRSERDLKRTIEGLKGILQQKIQELQYDMIDIKARIEEGRLALESHLNDTGHGDISLRRYSYRTILRKLVSMLRMQRNKIQNLMESLMDERKATAAIETQIFLLDHTVKQLEMERHPNFVHTFEERIGRTETSVLAIEQAFIDEKQISHEHKNLIRQQSNRLDVVEAELDNVTATVENTTSALDQLSVDTLTNEEDLQQIQIRVNGFQEFQDAMQENYVNITNILGDLAQDVKTVDELCSERVRNALRSQRNEIQNLKESVRHERETKEEILEQILLLGNSVKQMEAERHSVFRTFEERIGRTETSALALEQAFIDEKQISHEHKNLIRQQSNRLDVVEAELDNVTATVENTTSALDQLLVDTQTNEEDLQQIQIRVNEFQEFQDAMQENYVNITNILGDLAQDVKAIEERCPETISLIQQSGQPAGIVKGSRVVRGPDWKWGDQDGGGLGTVTDTDAGSGWMRVRWDFNKDSTDDYRMGYQGKVDLALYTESTSSIQPKRSEAPVDGPAIAAQIVVGTRVIRGPDWKWEDQDGNGPGTVTSISRIQDGWIRVRWDNGFDNNYRMGFKDKYDLSLYREQ